MGMKWDEERAKRHGVLARWAIEDRNALWTIIWAAGRALQSPEEWEGGP